MQSLLTLTAELIVIVPILFLALDFASGAVFLMRDCWGKLPPATLRGRASVQKQQQLVHLSYASATTQEDKPQEAIPKVQTLQIAIVPTPTDPEEITTLDDPWLAEIEVVVESFYYYAPATPERKGAIRAPKTVYLLPPAALSVFEQPEIDYSGWTIRALKKEAQNRKLSKYSSLTKTQLISRLTA